FVGRTPLPPLPQKLSPSQAARLAEILDFLHHHLSRATQAPQANEEATQVTLTFADWQCILSVQKLLARYLRAITEPDVLDASSARFRLPTVHLPKTPLRAIPFDLTRFSSRAMVALRSHGRRKRSCSLKRLIS